VEDVIEDAERRGLLFHFQACEYTAELELRFASFKVIIIIIIILSCVRRVVYTLSQSIRLKNMHITNRTAGGLVYICGVCSQSLRHNRQCLSCVGETWTARQC
jgi:hypothetical protein